MSLRIPARTLAVASLVALAAGPALADLARELGRNDVRVYSAAYPVVGGRTVEEQGLPERLERNGYRRVHRRPERPGDYFWGHEVFWIYRRAHRLAGRDHAAELLGLELRRRDGAVLGTVSADPAEAPPEALPWLEPELLAESLRGDRAPRVPVRFEELPEHVWRAVLAAEDSRFFDHVGIDGRSVARAALANVRAGGVTQGASTITQQLVKNRDLSPKRTMGRKVSEALRALSLEATYDKQEILRAYLDDVYLGHVSGLAVHGVGTAARVYFSKPAERLDLAEAALLAAMVQGPNRLSPLRHAERAQERRDWVIDRMVELGWVPVRDAAEARAAAVTTRLDPPRLATGRRFLTWVAQIAREAAPDRYDRGRGFVVETTLDPLLQDHAERTVRRRLEALRAGDRRLARAPLSAALVALDAGSGAVLAYVGGDPGEPDEFDRVRDARRQPGSAIKPAILLEAFESCGDRDPLHPATRIADEPLEVDLPSGTWRPENFDGRFHGVVDLRTALRRSLNVPFVRVAAWCGAGPVSERMRRAGLPVPDDPPPAFALGALEVTPLELAAAYTVFSTPGKRLEPRPVDRLERPGGRGIERFPPRRERVSTAASAYLVHDLLRDAVQGGTGGPARIDGVEVAGKTGTSSELRDAWFVGSAGGIVAAVWVGLDRGDLGLGGATVAAPLWRDFAERAELTVGPYRVPRPAGVIRDWIDPASGLRVGSGTRGAREELFRKGAAPRRNRFWRRDRAEPVVR